jgi:hypothetical protein
MWVGHLHTVANTGEGLFQLGVQSTPDMRGSVGKLLYSVIVLPGRQPLGAAHRLRRSPDCLARRLRDRKLKPRKGDSARALLPFS